MSLSLSVSSCAVMNSSDAGCANAVSTDALSTDARGYTRLDHSCAVHNKGVTF